MSFDIYGNNLRPGHCEVHPEVHQEYPCDLCIMENNRRKENRNERYCDGNPSTCQSASWVKQLEAENARLRKKLIEILNSEEWVDDPEQ